LKTYFLLLLCVLFWAGNFVLGRFVKDEVEPLELAFFRWFLTLLIISPILIFRFKRIVKSVKKNYLILLFLATLGIAAYNTLVYSALSMTTSTNALIINSTVPILILCLSFFILKQKIVLRQLVGIILSTIGVLFLILQGDFINIFSLTFNNGDLLIILSSILWATYSVFIKFRPKDLNNFEFFATIVFLGFFIFLPFFLTQNYSIQREIEVFQSNYLVFIYISVFTSCLSYYFWHYGIDTIGASKTGQFIHIMPIFGITLAYIFLGEKLMFHDFLGALLIMSGIYLSLFYKKEKVDR